MATQSADRIGALTLLKLLASSKIKINNWWANIWSSMLDCLLCASPWERRLWNSSFLVLGTWSTLKEHKNHSSMYLKPRSILSYFRTHFICLKRWCSLCHQDGLILIKTHLKTQLGSRGKSQELLVLSVIIMDGGALHIWCIFVILVLLISNCYLFSHFFISLKTQVKGKPGCVWRMDLGPPHFEQWRCWSYTCVILIVD